MVRTTALVGALFCAGLAQPALARVTAIEIRTVEPFADGQSFGEAGAYERVIGVARGELDPADPRNAGIVDLIRAPRNARGLVEYSTDIFMLRPKDPARASGTLLYEVLNRGRKFLFNWVLDAPPQAAQAVNDPRTVQDAGTALVLRRGDTVVWSGWEAEALRQQGGMAIDVPVATQGGAPIVETVRDELVSATRGPPEAPFFLTFKAANADKAGARLTVRRREADTPRRVPDDAWTFAGSGELRLLPATVKPEPGTLYTLRVRGHPGRRRPSPRTGLVREPGRRRDPPRGRPRHLPERPLPAGLHPPGLQPGRGWPARLRRDAAAHLRNRRGVPQCPLRPALAHQHPARGPSLS
jgi:hypothetical protein